eukprot:7956545-Pyramimonas_sp.AAC.1
MPLDPGQRRRLLRAMCVAQYLQPPLDDGQDVEDAALDVRSAAQRAEHKKCLPQRAFSFFERLL